MSNKCGIIERLKNEGKITSDQADTLQCKLEDNTNSITKVKRLVNEWLRMIFKQDKKSKSNSINTKIRYYTTETPNNNGSYISDFDVIVDKSNMPFSKIDQVDHFLSNLIGLAKNERLANDDEKKRDKSAFYSYFEKEVPMSFNTIDRDINVIDSDEPIKTSGGRRNKSRRKIPTKQKNKIRRTTRQKKNK
jgi:hypothetical protein